MVVGRPGDTITLQFSRPGAAKATPWRITLPRVLPRQSVRLSTSTVPPALKGSLGMSSPISSLGISSPISSSMLDTSGQRSLLVRGPEVGVRVVITCNEAWNNRYGHQDEAEADYKRMVLWICGVLPDSCDSCLVTLVSQCVLVDTGQTGHRSDR